MLLAAIKFKVGYCASACLISNLRRVSCPLLPQKIQATTRARREKGGRETRRTREERITWATWGSLPTFPSWATSSPPPHGMHSALPRLAVATSFCSQLASAREIERRLSTMVFTNRVSMNAILFLLRIN